MPIPDIIGDPNPRLHHPHNDPFNGPMCVFAQQIKPTNQLKQVVCDKSHLQPDFVRLEPVTTLLVQTSCDIIIYFNYYAIRRSIG